jgi:hypothetical protein
VRHHAKAAGPEQGSSSFLKKRTKKLLLCSVRASRIMRVNQGNKSFLVLFFKKELLLFLASCEKVAGSGEPGGEHVGC